ncbi:MAG: type IV pilus twitching motility protein PilT [Acidobacteriota bacterium]
MADHQDDALLGRLALHFKLITQEQLVEATVVQEREGGTTQFGEILVKLGYLTGPRLQQLLATQREYLAKRKAEAAAKAPPPSPAAVADSQRVIGEALRAVRPLDRVLEQAVRRGASDLHVHSELLLKMRLNGELIESNPLIDRKTAERVIREVMLPDQLAALDSSGQVDFSYHLPGLARFRCNVYRQQRGLDAVFRIIPERPPSLSDLGLPQILAKLSNYHQGMVLLTGPAGCGKSATMAAMVDIINTERRDHIITIEDPIEFVHPSKGCIVNQRAVGPHTGSFARALRAALREDPDVIAIGELRDLETISLALTAAETGHLVLATLHTSSAIRTINRIIGVFPAGQQSQVRTMLSESLRAVISQRLVPRADGHGRVAALEILIANKAVSALIREDKTFQIRSVLQTQAAQGMCLLDASLLNLVKAGTIAKAEALRYAEEPQRFGAV